MFALRIVHAQSGLARRLDGSQEHTDLRRCKLLRSARTLRYDVRPKDRHAGKRHSISSEIPQNSAKRVSHELSLLQRSVCRLRE